MPCVSHKAFVVRIHLAYKLYYKKIRRLLLTFGFHQPYEAMGSTKWIIKVSLGATNKELLIIFVKLMGSDGYLLNR